LAENIGKMVELTVVKAENGSMESVCLPVAEAEEENFHRLLPYHHLPTHTPV
jgi:hypothetical protein